MDGPPQRRRGEPRCGSAAPTSPPTCSANWRSRCWLKSTEGAAKKKGDKTGPTRFLSAEGVLLVARGAQPSCGCESRRSRRSASTPHRAASRCFSVGGAVHTLPGRRGADGRAPQRAGGATAGEPCRLALPAVHPKSGAEAAVAVAADGCGKWILLEFRMCATNLPADKQAPGAPPSHWARATEASTRRRSTMRRRCCPTAAARSPSSTSRSGRSVGGERRARRRRPRRDRPAQAEGDAERARLPHHRRRDHPLELGV